MSQESGRHRDADVDHDQALLGRLVAAWQCGPPAPDLNDFLTPRDAHDESAVLRLVRCDVLERQRVRALPRWRDHEIPISVEHYERIVGTIEPGSDLAQLLIMAELVNARDQSVAELETVLARLRLRFPDDVESVARLVLQRSSVASAPESFELASSRFGVGANDEAQSRRSHPLIGRTIGRYRLGHIIGRGGMGVVYEAEQEDPRRMVALKVINPGFACDRSLRRFEHEAQILGRLQHAGIAQIYEAGTFEVGSGAQPFFAMEFVRGEPLTRYAERHGLSMDAKLRLMVAVCHAVQHAHQRGIIHRDLKPGNILVDDEGHPKVLDFGVARATESDAPVATRQTNVGELLGTLPYMSPEQASGDPDDLDVRSDVYALGVIAYELLAGQLPYAIDHKLIHEGVRVILEEEPRRLSSVSRGFRGDVEIMIAKALQKEKDRRYQSAVQFADDIERYLNHDPIVARPSSVAYQFRRFARRHKGFVGGVAMTMLALLAGLALALTLYARASEARADALAAEAEALQRAEQLQVVSEFQAEMLGQIDPYGAGQLLTEEVRGRLAIADAAVGLPASEQEERWRDFGEDWNRINATETAIALIDETILKPAISVIDSRFPDQPLVAAHLRQVISDRYRELGRYEAAMPLQEVALETRRRLLGEEHQSTIVSVNNMGQLLWLQGRHADALPYCSSALDLSERVLGSDHAGTIQALSNMGNLLRDLGLHSEAESHYREALTRSRRAFGPDDPQLLQAINNMGLLLVPLGRFEEGIAYFHEALGGFRRTLGSEHAHTLIVIHNIASALRDQGRYHDARPYFLEAIEGRRRVLGDGHPQTLHSISGFGVLLHHAGAFPEAAALYSEALEGQRRVLGAEHPETIETLGNLATLLRDSGQLAEAERHNRDALALSRRVHGETHQSTIALLASRAGVLSRMGRLDEAEQYAREALDNARDALGIEHHQTLSAIGTLGGVLFAQRRFGEAEVYGREALAMRRRAYGDDHPNTQTAIHNLGIVLREQGKLDDAATTLREALELRLETLGADHGDTLVSATELGWALNALGDHAAAIELLSPLQDVARTAFADADPRFLGRLLQAVGQARVGLALDVEQFRLAESELLEAHALLSVLRFQPNIFAIDCANALADLYEAWHRVDGNQGHDASARQWRAAVDGPP